MPKPDANVVVRRRRGRCSVLVDGRPMAGVVNVEFVRPIKERMGEDGWVERVPAGEPVLRIEVLGRLAVFEESDA